MMMNANILLVPVLLPMAVGLFTFVLPRKDLWVRGILALLTAGAALAVAVRIFLGKGVELRIPLFAIGRFSLDFDLMPTPLSSFILLFATGFALLAALYSLSYMRGRNRYREYFALYLFALGGTAGVLLADHLLVFLIFWEIVTASLYFLIATGGVESKAGATKTFAMLGGADGCLLLGIGVLWFMTRSFSISSLEVPVVSALPAVAFVLMMVGAITKAGSMPFHSWVPAASEGAPASVMALLPASLDKLLGIYLLTLLATRIFVLSHGLGLLLMIIGAVTIVAAVMVAMVQHDLPRLLAYHAVSQVGYMLLGIGTMNPVGIAGGVFHMLNNSIYKNCLFLCAGAVEKKTGTTDLAALGGLARVMPLTFGGCLVSALAISGVPPFNGFVSKWLVYQGVLATGSPASFIFLVAAMFGSALTLASFIKVIYAVFLGTRSEVTRGVEGAVGFAMALPVVLLALLSLAFGVVYRFPLARFIYPAIGVQAAPAGVWNSTWATGLIVLGLVLGLVLYLLGRYRRSARVVAPFIGGEELDPATGRVLGTHFYDTIRDLPLLKRIYAGQEKGRLDPYTWIGALGLGITGVLRRIHNGLLSWYLAWSAAGIVILLVLFILIRGR
jgi:formate hydrogenlyase subunit 3/multisubunit Na+/H+ antiporter MnhD subunit